MSILIPKNKVNLVNKPQLIAFTKIINMRNIMKILISEFIIAKVLIYGKRYCKNN
jgi:hypothetical protein